METPLKELKMFFEKPKPKKVFLGGTCNESTWRDKLIPMLSIDYFNPVVKDWTPEAQYEETRQKILCEYQLYVITPKMTGAFSIAEAVDCSNKSPSKLVFVILSEDGDKAFDQFQLKSLQAVSDLIKINGGYTCSTLKEAADWLNLKLPDLNGKFMRGDIN